MRPRHYAFIGNAGTVCQHCHYAFNAGVPVSFTSTNALSSLVLAFMWNDDDGERNPPCVQFRRAGSWGLFITDKRRISGDQCLVA